MDWSFRAKWRHSHLSEHLCSSVRSGGQLDRNQASRFGVIPHTWLTSSIATWSSTRQVRSRPSHSQPPARSSPTHWPAPSPRSICTSRTPCGARTRTPSLPTCFTVWASSTSRSCRCSSASTKTTCWITRSPWLGCATSMNLTLTYQRLTRICPVWAGAWVWCLKSSTRTLRLAGSVLRPARVSKPWLRLRYLSAGRSIMKFFIRNYKNASRRKRPSRQQLYQHLRPTWNELVN